MPIFSLIVIIFCILTTGCSVSGASKGRVVSKPIFFGETFEKLSIGTFQNEDPWHYFDSEHGKIKVDVIDRDCAVGKKCLKVNRFSISADPRYNADLFIKTGEYGDYPELYFQFYVKYLFSDTVLSVIYSTGANFIMNLSSDGVVMQPGDVKIVEGHILPERWYRIECRLNHGKAAVADIGVYEADELEPVAGSTKVQSIPVREIYRSDKFEILHNISVRNSSSYLFQNPNTELDKFSYFLDSLVLSDDPSILKVGFGP